MMNKHDHEAMAMLDEMRKAGLAPTLTTYNLLLPAASRDGTASILKLFDRMQAENIQPGAYAARFVLPPLIEQKDLRRGYKLLPTAVAQSKSDEARRRLAQQYRELALAATQQSKPKLAQLCDYQHKQLDT